MIRWFHVTILIISFILQINGTESHRSRYDPNFTIKTNRDQPIRYSRYKRDIQDIQDINYRYVDYQIDNMYTLNLNGTIKPQVELSYSNIHLYNVKDILIILNIIIFLCISAILIKYLKSKKNSNIEIPSPTQIEHTIIDKTIVQDHETNIYNEIKREISSVTQTVSDNESTIKGELQFLKNDDSLEYILNRVLSGTYESIIKIDEHDKKAMLGIKLTDICMKYQDYRDKKHHRRLSQDQKNIEIQQKNIELEQNKSKIQCQMEKVQNLKKEKIEEKMYRLIKIISVFSMICIFIVWFFTITYNVNISYIVLMLNEKVTSLLKILSNVVDFSDVNHDNGSYLLQYIDQYSQYFPWMGRVLSVFTHIFGWYINLLIQKFFNIGMLAIYMLIIYLFGWKTFLTLLIAPSIILLWKTFIQVTILYIPVFFLQNYLFLKTDGLPYMKKILWMMIYGILSIFLCCIIGIYSALTDVLNPAPIHMNFVDMIIKIFQQHIR